MVQSALGDARYRPGTAPVARTSSGTHRAESPSGQVPLQPVQQAAQAELEQLIEVQLHLAVDQPGQQREVSGTGDDAEAVLLGLHPLVAREPRVLLGLGLSLKVEAQ